MTTIRTGNNRHRAKAARMQRRRYAAFDFETCGLNPMTGEDILAANARIVYAVDRQPDFVDLGIRSSESIEDIARTIDVFVKGTGHLTGLSRFADYGPEILVDRGDNANPTSVASAVEDLSAMAKRLGLEVLLPRAWERNPFVVGYGPIPPKEALTDEERLMIEDTMAMFSKPDDGISPEHATYMDSMPSFDEFVENLPDGLPDDQPKS